ncbi:hypothetical protein BJ878DRAFT_541881 [Calycina marina]|uniref:SPX domain-containing protein n=1 Tax=Calycina marina TaxID=1763456 RepID=A0A9P7Z4N8_9HELO|nr:hypothetical protein BJ878DRAFT_541881 [Calycina marina]
MKYGEALHAQALPRWAPYNVDYNELKNLIKAHTTKDQGSAIAIPGQINPALSQFEDIFYSELVAQHDRVDLFVKDKAGEIGRRLQHLHTVVLKLLSRLPYSNGRPMSNKRRERFAKYDNQIERCGEDVKQLQRFVDAQRIAFHKILKKYKKWTVSSFLVERFNQQVLAERKSFTRRDLTPLLISYRALLNDIREHTPDTSGPPTPRLSRRPSHQVQVERVPQSYWNEYDNGSEARDEPYTIYVDPNAESTFPGAKTVSHILSGVKVPMGKVKLWLGSSNASPPEQRSLLDGENRVSTPSRNAYFPAQIETDIDDDASSSDFPSGYATHYSKFPSIREQKFEQYKDKLIFQTTIASFVGSILLLLIASLLIMTGRHKLRVEVDVGAIMGVVASLFFATAGFGMMLYQNERVGWVQKFLVGATFTVVCILNGFLLVLIGENTGP